jgi:hypothetical protein
MIGFPDETREEIETTVKFAYRMVQNGFDHANFFLLMPVPGTPMFDYCIAKGHLSPDYNPDNFQWTKANLLNTAVPAAELEKIRDKAWNDCNTERFKKIRRSWLAAN